MTRIFSILLTSFFVGAVALPALGLGGGDDVAVCHRNRLGHRDGTVWTLLKVGGPAAHAHEAHGDGAPGGPVPDAEGWTFDGSCTPQPPGFAPVTTTTTTTTSTTTTTTTTAPPTTTTTTTTAPPPPASDRCFDGLFDTYDLSVEALGVDDGATLWTSTDGTCSEGVAMWVTVVSGADKAEASEACASILGGAAGFYFPLRLEPIFPEAPSDWWLCP